MYFYVNDIKCDIITTFKNKDINYVVYTNGTKDDNGSLEVYASRYSLINNEYILEDIIFDEEWDLIDSKLAEME